MVENFIENPWQKTKNSINKVNCKINKLESPNIVHEENNKDSKILFRVDSPLGILNEDLNIEIQKKNFDRISLNVNFYIFN